MFAESADAARLHARWGWIFGAGVVLAILGVLALLNPVNATLVTPILVGWLLIGGGVMEIFGAFMSHDSAGWRLLHGGLGVLYILVGFDLIADPLSGVVTLTVVVGILLMVDGGIRAFKAFSIPERRWLSLTIAVLDFILAFWILSGIPWSGVAIGFFVGLMLMFAGVNWMVTGWSARNMGNLSGGAPA